MTKYRVFKRRAGNWEEFLTACKIIIRRGLTYDEARRMCAEYNDNQNQTQIRIGTKMEFEAE